MKQNNQGNRKELHNLGEIDAPNEPELLAMRNQVKVTLGDFVDEDEEYLAILKLRELSGPMRHSYLSTWIAVVAFAAAFLGVVASGVKLSVNSRSSSVVGIVLDIIALMSLVAVVVALCVLVWSAVSLIHNNKKIALDGVAAAVALEFLQQTSRSDREEKREDRSSTVKESLTQQEEYSSKQTGDVSPKAH